jgi:signal peptide peptidase SppA
MLETFGARTLWAMHPDALGDLLKRGSVEAMLPEALKALAGFSGAASAAKQADPVRDGATVIIPLSGPLSPKGSYGGTSTERFSNQIREAGADRAVGAIVVNAMSPGGLVFGTAEAGDAVYEVRQSKPVIAVASPYAYSAAHWICTQCTAFYATTSGGVGSAGVRGGHVDMSGFEEKIGMKTTLIASDRQKIAGHPYAPLSDEDRAEMQAEIDEMNRAFVAAIARGRGINVADVPALHGTGGTFSAQRAAELGVTDGVMTLRDVVAKFSSSRARLALMRRRAAAMAASF